MPGYVMHLAMSERIIKKRKVSDLDYIGKFMLGSIIPDTVKRREKQNSHYWLGNTIYKFARKPDVDAFYNEYKDELANPYLYGYFCHLYLDKLYLDNYWKKHFTFLDNSKEECDSYEAVTEVLLDKEILYGREEFFSDKLYYGDYDIINKYFIAKDNIEYTDIKNMFDLLYEGNALREYINPPGKLEPYAKKDEIYKMLKGIEEADYVLKNKPEVLCTEEIDELIDLAVRDVLQVKEKSCP